MGAYDVGLLERAQGPASPAGWWSTGRTFRRSAPVELWPVMRHRMDHYRATRGKRGVGGEPRARGLAAAEVRERGASTARDLDDGLPRSKEQWGWNWSNTCRVLDFLYRRATSRSPDTSQFEVLYDLPSRSLRRPCAADAEPRGRQLELVRRAAAASCSVATARCLRDYYRMHTRHVQPAIDELVEEGELVPVAIDGWKRPAYLHRDARLPRRVNAGTAQPVRPGRLGARAGRAPLRLPLQIEIYVPAPQRVHGYYVLPFLLGTGSWPGSTSRRTGPVAASS